ncbi:MAG: (d)CMP kinase, partial [Lachnospiraceae bacterium]|nr:(d)CMP kinase [Lachnospiraceae bacterium]
KNVKLKALRRGKTVYEEQGEMLFTHYGISGPLVLTISSVLGRSIEKGEVMLSLDMKPALNEDKLNDRFLRDFGENANRQLKTVLTGMMPQSMIPVFLEITGIPGDRKVNSVTREERSRMVSMLKDIRLTPSSLRGWDEAVITKGGVDTRDIDPGTMESKIVKGLYFAGEIIDTDALTGGFNLQIAWSTGFAAGTGAGEENGLDKKHFSIALDGPSGAGKSTIAKIVAKKLGFTYIDTGAMYRVIGLYCLENGVDTGNSEAVINALDSIDVGLSYIDGEQHVYLNGRDVSGLIRQENVGNAASAASAIPEVREKLLDMQRGMAEKYDVVMDGRDIGTRILPDADEKIFMTASVEVRAMRRVEQLRTAGADPDPEAVKKDLEERDYRDTHREIAPLKMADDAILIDTSYMTIEEVADRIIAIAEERR